jgi:hypothetical protein
LGAGNGTRFRWEGGKEKGEERREGGDVNLHGPWKGVRCLAHWITVTSRYTMEHVTDGRVCGSRVTDIHIHKRKTSR